MNVWRRNKVPVIMMLSLLAVGAGKIIQSTFVDWEKTSVVKTHTGWTRNLFRSQTSCLEAIEAEEYTLYPGKETHQSLIDRGNDVVYIIKEGTASITLNNVTTHLTEGGVAVASQGNRIEISNKTKSSLVYYSVRIKPKYVRPSPKTQKKERTFFSYTDTIRPETISAGNIFQIFDRNTSSLKNLDVHTIRIKSDFNNRETTDGREEEIVIVRKGIVFGTLRNRDFRLGTGSLIFLTSGEKLDIGNGAESGSRYYVIKWLAWSPEPKKQ